MWYYFAGVYYCVHIVIIVLSVVFSSLVVLIENGRSGNPPPKWLKVVRLTMTFNRNIRIVL